MVSDRSIKRIAVVGTGVIGASWAAYYLARSFDVVATDPGIFDKAYATATAGSAPEHTYVAPDLFNADTPLGAYQGISEQVVMSRTPGQFRTILVPRGSSRPEWLSEQ